MACQPFAYVVFIGGYDHTLCVPAGFNIFYVVRSLAVAFGFCHPELFCKYQFAIKPYCTFVIVVCAADCDARGVVYFNTPFENTDPDCTFRYKGTAVDYERTIIDIYPMGPAAYSKVTVKGEITLIYIYALI